MDNKQHIVISSFSDCREKNGIVTFMNIIRRNAARFDEHGIQVLFTNYVDFPELDEQPGWSEPALVVTPACVATKPPSPLRRWMLATKWWLKGQLTKHPLLAFLLMTVTLSRRGLIVALKARRLDGPGCVHFHQDAFSALFGQWLLRRDSRRVLLLHSGNDPLRQLFLHFHGMRGTPYEIRVRNAFYRMLGGLDGIVTLNERYATTLRDEFPHVDVRCIYNTSPFASEIDKYLRPAPLVPGTPGRRVELVAVGSLQPIKGFDLLVDAAAGLTSAERERLHITIVGGGAQHASLQYAIDTHGLQDMLTLIGESDDVASYLARADGFILTSRDEGFPIALIEASSFGLPIISTRVGAIPEVFDESSCLFMDAEAGSIRTALIGIAHDTVDLGALARRSREVFDAKLSLDAFLSAYCKLFIEMGRIHAR